MDKIKRVLAIIGVLILIGLYGTTLVSAVLVTPATKKFFEASLLATVMIPILLYVYVWLYHLIKGDDEEEIEAIIQEAQKEEDAKEEKKS